MDADGVGCTCERLLVCDLCRDLESDFDDDGPFDYGDDDDDDDPLEPDEEGFQP